MTELLGEMTTTYASSYGEELTVEVDPMIRERAEMEARRMDHYPTIYYAADGFGAIVTNLNGKMVTVFTTCGCCANAMTAQRGEERVL